MTTTIQFIDNHGNGALFIDVLDHLPEIGQSVKIIDPNGGQISGKVRDIKHIYTLVSNTTKMMAPDVTDDYEIIIYLEEAKP